MAEGLRIYNLLTRIAGSADRWTEHVRRAKAMGFNAVYVNPFHYPGFSGSLYAPKDYYRLNPVFVPPGAGPGVDALKPFIAAVRAEGLLLVMDLVINHTAIDCDLTREHPEWYLRDASGRIKNPSAIDPADARRVTVWGDLAEIDNEHSCDRDNLWKYWERLVETYLNLGFDGFRCDAAYQVCSGLWRYLFERARRVKPGVFFIAETLGCRENDIARLAQDGFDYIYNSSKWWNFSDDWCLRQYDLSRRHAPSLSFPETHDTERLSAETGGLEQVSRLRYLFAALFSKGLLMPLGYEYGFKKRFNVVTSSPVDWETPTFDISGFITAVNRLKASFPVFNEDNPATVVPQSNPGVLALKKVSLDGAQTALLVINKDWRQPNTVCLESTLGEILETSSLIRDVSPDKKSSDKAPEVSGRMNETLAPARMRVFLAGKRA